MRPRVVVVSTGGTFAMTASGDAGSTLSLRGGELEIDTLVPELRAIAVIEHVSLFQLDSGDFQPSHWVQLAFEVHAAVARADVTGVVVVHGTDTMSYTASALAFLLGPLPKPVVLTGAQRPLADVRSDARGNLIDAVLSATLAVPEVVVAFASRVLRGCRTVKADAWALDAFASPACAALVELGVAVDVAHHVRAAAALRPLDARLEPRVLAVRVFPGLSPALLTTAVRSGVRGLVLEGYGTGNLPHGAESSLIPAIEEARSVGVAVVVVSQCARGRVELSRYQGGDAAARAGAIDGGDMTVEAAIAKLMVALARSRDDREVAAFMLAEIVGERTNVAR